MVGCKGVNPGAGVAAHFEARTQVKVSNSAKHSNLSPMSCVPVSKAETNFSFLLCAVGLMFGLCNVWPGDRTKVANMAATTYYQRIAITSSLVETPIGRCYAAICSLYVGSQATLRSFDGLYGYF